ncbi:MAG: hypothetical protein ACP5PS_02965 [Bacteroidales bacterium]
MGAPGASLRARHNSPRLQRCSGSCRLHKSPGNDPLPTHCRVGLLGQQGGEYNFVHFYPGYDE